METKNKIVDAEFHAVEFMRKVRRELSEKYLQDKKQYMKDLKKAMEDFKCRQKKAYSQHIGLKRSFAPNDLCKNGGFLYAQRFDLSLC